MQLNKFIYKYFMQQSEQEGERLADRRLIIPAENCCQSLIN